MDDLDLRRLRCFVVVAETLSFVRAAAALHIAQPALSRQIAALEKSLGVRLFERSRRGTSLTGPGAEMLDDAKALLSSAAELQRRARTAARSPTQFTIGFMPGVEAAGLIRSFRECHPELDVSALFTSMTDQVDFIADGRVDVAFVRLPLGTDAFDVVPLLIEPVVAAVLRGGALGQAERVWMADLDEPLSLTSDGQRHTIEELLLAVATGSAHALLPAGIAAFYSDPDIAYVPVVDGPPVQVALAYDNRRVMPAIHAFVEVCRDELEPALAAVPEILQQQGRELVSS